LVLAREKALEKVSVHLLGMLWEQVLVMLSEMVSVQE
jgi:hypothetical protein